MGVNLSSAFHTYGILWTPTQITWYIDGISRQVLRKSDYPTTQWPFGARSDGSLPRFYAILNVAMGGMGGTIGNQTSSTMTIDYVRYYSVDGQGTLTTY